MSRDELVAIRVRYADGFGDIEQAAEDVGTLLGVIDRAPVLPRCRESTVIRLVQRIGDPRPPERIAVCDRAEGHGGHHVGNLDGGGQVLWS